ncbi:unnamed protein product [Rotaria sp. Silwood2]|nr:unnamed protein product [Rotaria sp. Silwood2]CAF4314500.1 unnamed protein product [Rotaria sp. Silwood2]
MERILRARNYPNLYGISLHNIQAKTARDLFTSYCHIYSYPYTLKYYDDITNNFPGGILIYVRKVSLFDERPFEHEFFLRIQKSFPFMEELTVRNEKRQINKQFRKSKNSSILNILILNNLILFKVA